MVRLALECHDGKSSASFFGRHAEFSLLTAAARARVVELLGKELVYLQIYLKESDRDLESTQPTLDLLNAHPELASAAWSPFLDWLARRADRFLLFLNDTVWDDRWQNVKEVLAKRGVREVDLHPTSRPGFFAARASSRTVGQIVRSWWPSRAGDFAAVSLMEQASDALLDQMSTTCRIGAADVDMVNLFFETSRQYENLGMDVLIRQASSSKTSFILDG